MPPPEPFVEPARRRVALGLLIGEVIKTRGIQIDRAAVDARLAELAATYPDPEAILKAYRQNAGCAAPGREPWCSRTRWSTTCSSGPR